VTCVQQEVQTENDLIYLTKRQEVGLIELFRRLRANTYNVLLIWITRSGSGWPFETLVRSLDPCVNQSVYACRRVYIVFR
jgi:hypothetical protein